MIAFDNEIIERYGSGGAFAVIDTGTTMIGIPTNRFTSLRAKWNKQIGSDPNFICNDAAL